MLKIKLDINRQNFKIVYLHFVNPELIFTHSEVANRVVGVVAEHSNPITWRLKG